MLNTSQTRRDDIIFVLNEATELEHSLSCSYLFAAMSLKSSDDEGLSPEALEATRGWKRTLTGIAIEEMFHLAVINHLLVALGAAPNFDRPNFPHDCAYYMPEYQIELRPFNESTMRHFVAIEQPDGLNLPAVLAPDRLTRVVGDMDNEIGADPMQFDSQRDVYHKVKDGLAEMVERLGEANVFIGPAPRAALRGFLESGDWRSDATFEATAFNLAQVVEQGEGASYDNPNSHYARFQAVLDEYELLRAADPDFEPARPVLMNPFTRIPPEEVGPVNLIDDEDAIRVSDLFNEAYGAMLQLLARFFVTTEETDAEASALCDAAIELMSGVVAPLGDLLTRLPAGPSHPGATAGPSFVVRTLHALPYKDAAWRLLRERVGELEAYSRGLADEGGRFESLARVADTLHRIGDTLTSA